MQLVRRMNEIVAVVIIDCCYCLAQFLKAAPDSFRATLLPKTAAPSVVPRAVVRLKVMPSPVSIVSPLTPRPFRLRVLPMIFKLGIAMLMPLLRKLKWNPASARSVLVCMNVTLFPRWTNCGPSRPVGKLNECMPTGLVPLMFLITTLFPLSVP